MAEANGKPVIIPEQTERKPYRPTASTEEVHDTIARCFSDIVCTSASQARMFTSLFDLYDKDETLMVRFGHLVDATECLEIAVTHLGQLRTMVANRLSWEEERAVLEDRDKTRRRELPF
jgi:Ca2+-binding EF-hand superfamily protein